MEADYSSEPWYFGDCLRCSRTLRKASGYPRNPHSVVHKGYGLCPKCYWKERGKGDIPYRESVQEAEGKYLCALCNRLLEISKIKKKGGRPTKACKECTKLKERYGISWNEYSKWIETQEGRCRVCLSTVSKTYGKKTAYVDHNHKTGRVRGILCNTCNLGVGVLKTDGVKYKKYLQKPRVTLPTEKCRCPYCREIRNYTGLTCIQYNYLINRCGFRCSICERSLSRTFFVDHDHTCCPSAREYSCNKCIRGLLCRSCNSALGFFHEDPQKIINAWEYLKEDEDHEKNLRTRSR